MGTQWLTVLWQVIFGNLGHIESCAWLLDVRRCILLVRPVGYVQTIVQAPCAGASGGDIFAKMKKTF